MKKLICLLLAIGMLFTVGCKKQAGRLAKEILINEAADAVTNSASKSNKSPGTNTKPPSPSPAANGVAKSAKGKAGVAAAVVGGAVAAVVSSNTDLILGKIYIGQSQADALQIMGEPIKVSDPDNNGHLRYKYSDMVVVITGGVVTGFVSDTAAVSTKRGIKQGDALDKVVREYGKPYAQSDYDGTTLYEYKFTSDRGQDCLLRFAMKNGVVDYISGRVL